MSTRSCGTAATCNVSPPPTLLSPLQLTSRACRLDHLPPNWVERGPLRSYEGQQVRINLQSSPPYPHRRGWSGPIASPLRSRNQSEFWGLRLHRWRLYRIASMDAVSCRSKGEIWDLVLRNLLGEGSSWSLRQRRRVSCTAAVIASHHIVVKCSRYRNTRGVPSLFSDAQDI